MNVRQAEKDVNAAYQLIGKLSVSGDAVDVIAAARAALRSAISALNSPEGAQPKENAE